MTIEEVKNTKIGIAEQECRDAHAAHPSATAWWCGHHGVELEPAFWPTHFYINFILGYYKSPDEKIGRLRNFRPFVGELPNAVAEVLATWTKAFEHRRDMVEMFHISFNARCSMDGPPIDLRNNKEDDGVREAGVNLKSANIALWEVEERRDRVYAINFEALTRLHREQVPHHTWNGKSIFTPDERLDHLRYRSELL